MNKLTGKLVNAEWGKVVKGAALAGAGALLTYLADETAKMDLGNYSLLVAAGLATLMNAVRKVYNATD